MKQRSGGLGFSPLPFLVGIIGLGAVLRFTKLDWGEGYFFNPDEYHIAAAVTRLSFPDSLDPQFFSYGSLTIYLVAILYFLVDSLSWFPPPDPILVGRFLSALFSTGTIAVVYFLARQLWPQVGLALLAAFLVATSPGLVQQAHFATPESALTFWLLLMLASGITWVRSGRRFLLVLTSIFLGLGVGTKVVALLYLPLLILLVFLRRSGSAFSLLTRVRDLGVALLVAGLTFLVVSPYSLLDLPKFRSALTYEAGVARGDPVVFYTRQFIGTVPFVFQLQRVLPYALGPTVAVLGIAGLGLTILELLRSLFEARRQVPRALFLVVTAFLLWIVPNGLLFVKWTRFLAPSFPFFSLFVAYLVARLVGSERGGGRWALALLSLPWLAIHLLWSAMVFSIYLSPDVRLRATRLFNDQLPVGTILTESRNMLVVPLAGPQRVLVFDVYQLEDPWVAASLPRLLEEADYFVVQNRRVFLNHLRLAGLYPTTRRFYELLLGGGLGFREVARVSSFPGIEVGRMRLAVDDETAEETWTVFDHPVIRIYQKVSPIRAEDYGKLLALPG